MSGLGKSLRIHRQPQIKLRRTKTMSIEIIFAIAGLMALTLILLMAMFARLYRKAGPHEALVVYGFRGTRIIKGRGSVIFPMVENCKQIGRASCRERV